MKNNIASYVGWLLLLSVLAFYVYGIEQAISLSWPKDPITENAYSEVLSTTIGSIQALLLTNLGIVLGISIAKPESSLARQILLRTTNPVAKLIPDPLEYREKVQLFALIVYVFSLIVCLVTWIHNGFSIASKDVISVIPESSKMFIGVVLAYLTAVLGK